jgi:transcriptional regulator with XRE-family HTH domain
VTNRDPQEPLSSLGSFIRTQRHLANLSIRQLASLAEVSNPYLSQVERGLHAPSVRILRSLAQALNVSSDTLLRHAGLIDEDEPDDAGETEAAIRADTRLSEAQKSALLTVYRSYIESNDSKA